LTKTYYTYYGEQQIPYVLGCCIPNIFFAEVLPDNVRLTLAGSKVRSEAPQHQGLIPGAPSATHIGFNVLVEQLIRIQLGTVAGQEEYPYAVGILVQPVLHLSRAIDRVFVKNHVHSSLTCRRSLLRNFKKT